MGSISGELGAKSVNLSKQVWVNPVELLRMHFLLVWEERYGLPVFQLPEHGQNRRPSVQATSSPWALLHKSTAWAHCPHDEQFY